MDWINYLQERIAITKTEGIAVMTLAGLLLSGLVIQRAWYGRATVPEDYYAAMDSAFAAATRNLGDTLDASLHTQTDTADTSEKELPAEPAAVRININTANARQLQQLSGIGPVLARRITVFRERNGPFAAVEDLVEVSGIGPKTLENIRTLLYLKERPAARDSVEH